MFSSKSLGFGSLVKCVRAILHMFKSACRRNGRKKRKPKRMLSPCFDCFSSPFAAMELSSQLKQVFKLIDANGDGKISSLELGEVLVCLGHEKATATKQAEGMVREVDCNGDGFIDLEEFIEVVGERNESGIDSKDELMDAFLVFDSDMNGFISAKELQRVLISLGHSKCSLEEFLLMIRGVDKDGNGLVDFEEFRSMMTQCVG